MILNDFSHFPSHRQSAGIRNSEFATAGTVPWLQSILGVSFFVLRVGVCVCLSLSLSLSPFSSSSASFFFLLARDVTSLHLHQKLTGDDETNDIVFISWQKVQSVDQEA